MGGNSTPDSVVYVPEFVDDKQHSSVRLSRLCPTISQAAGLHIEMPTSQSPFDDTGVDLGINSIFAGSSILDNLAKSPRLIQLGTINILGRSRSQLGVGSLIYGRTKYLVSTEYRKKTPFK